jgi:hypothetical protein
MTTPATVTNTQRQAIVTRWHSPTNTKGARMSASAGAGRVSIPYAHGLNLADNHAAAASALVTKLQWLSNGERMIGGGCLPSGDYAWVIIDAA